MRRSKYRRADSSPKWFSRKRRLAAAAATLVAFGALLTVTQVSEAGTKRSTQRALSACDRLEAPKAQRLSSETKRGTYTTNKGRVTQHSDDGASNAATTAQLRSRCRQWVAQNVSKKRGNNGKGGGQSAAPVADNNNDGNTNDGDNNNNNNNNNGQAPPPGAGLGVLTNNCGTSNLEPHDGFQNGDRCVSTAFGEVGSRASNPTLLITEAPEQVEVNQPFTLQVSTRNLIRDRFLAAGQGGYYVESSVLEGGIVRGHFHTGCRILGNTNEAPDPDPIPAFFVATEDGKGNRTPDTVAIQVPGIPDEGDAQCASWAGDGSHRIPMMQAANQIPAFDSVRIRVVGANNDNNNNDNNNNDGQGDNNNDGQGDNNNNDNNDNNNNDGQGDNNNNNDGR